jgi:alpha-mannosidase
MAWEEVLRRARVELETYRSAPAWEVCVCEAETPQALEEAVDAGSSSWGSVSFPHPLTQRRDYWFRTRLTIPGNVQGIDVAGSQAALRCFVINPTEVYINGNRVFRERFWSDLRTPEVVLSSRLREGETFDVLVHTANTGTSGMRSTQTITYEIEQVEDVIYDLETFGYELAYCGEFPELTDVVARARACAEERMSEDAGPGSLQETIAACREMLASAEGVTKQYRVHLVGHAHIDMNWLWTMDDTIDVCKRDFSTMSGLMKEEPDFRFSQSQAAVYDIAEVHAPETFRRMQEAVKNGQWEVTAATWTEGDLNLANGEAIVRHILLSRRYLLDRFGTRSRVCWEPDTFGHPATVPQILKKAGIEYYYHSRCGAGYPLYWWQGADGSRVLAFTSPYNNTVNPKDITAISLRLRRDHGLADALFVYGVGDHGGGPTRRDIRRAKWLDSLPTMPRVAFGAAHEFFDAVRSADPQTLPVTTGEMNPIFDGCYTTHSDIKRLNRGCEHRLLEAEAASVLAGLFGRTYEASRIADGWRTVAFNQFHDIYDGCGIHETYDQATKELETVAGDAEDVVADALGRIADHVARPGEGSWFAVWNLQGFRRTDVVRVPAVGESVVVSDAAGEPVVSQVHDGSAWFVARDVPAFGYRLFRVEPGGSAEAHSVEHIDGMLRSETEAFVVEVGTESGCIHRLYDKRSGRELFPDSPHTIPVHRYNNRFAVDYEAPHGMSAWVIGPITRSEELIRGAAVSVEASGPVMDVIRVERPVAESRIVQHLCIYRDLPRLDFDTVVEWNEVSDAQTDAPTLRVAFTPHLASPRVAYEVPFGHVERPADGAEYPGQRWVDISGDSAGLSLLNDGKYGFRAAGTELSMTCIRTSYQPDPVPAKGVHRFRYALVPHEGDFRLAKTPQKALSFNSPLRSVKLSGEPDGSLDHSQSWLEVTSGPAAVSALKAGETGSHIIVRVYETDGTGGPVQLRIGFPIAGVEVAPLSEDGVVGHAVVADGELQDHLAPHEIKTYRIRLSGSRT